MASSGKARESLSQFVARVLDQLSLSAWLPSAALVLSLAFTYHLARALDAERHAVAGILSAPQSPGALSDALTGLAHTSLGGALLLIMAVVVLTIATQAFAFEAIRTLEGYWGTWRPVEWVAGETPFSLRW